MKGKYTKYIILILVLLVFIIGFKMYKNTDKVLNGGFLGSQWIDGENNKSYMVTIKLESDYSHEQIDFFTNIATKKRKDKIDISEASNLGDSTHYMTVFISEKSTGVTKWVFDFNLWLKEDIGYIQPQDKENFNSNQSQDLRNISKLDDEEHKFLVDALLKYHSKEFIFKK